MGKIEFDAIEQDVLKEIGNMCAGNATTALAEILGRRIELELPDMKVVGISALPGKLKVDPEEPVVGVHVQIWGGVRGNAVMILSSQDAFSLLDILLGLRQDSPSALTEVGISALKEIGNIVVNAYLSALSAITGISAFPSTVTLSSGAAKSVINLIFSGLHKDKPEETILVEAHFKDKTKDMAGNFFIVFDVLSIGTILKKAQKLDK
ncbi:MAG: chemotaxis protein CheC [Candidatus Omnitrophica bacterium]|jgi:chemotaxis protein CheC|nr:chemotaxis protein CheC [Candidatus Omnitrophota bacterium]MDD5079349.1 chemotaxis protein CheC [Candidatus Omnitrophota bacterium]